MTHNKAVKLLSWNIWGGKYLDEVIRYLKAADADIIALQEVIEDKTSNTALTIAKALSYECVYETKMTISSNKTGPAREKEEMVNFGEAVLSRYKIVGNKSYLLSESGKRGKRIAVQADIQINDSLLHIVSVHLRHSHLEKNDAETLTLQNEQADKLISMVPREKTVVMGDFNATPESYAVKKMKEVFKDTDKSSSPTWSVYREGCGVCLAEGIKYKIDYIFTSKDLNVVSSEVGNSKASDHLPLIVSIDI